MILGWRAAIRSSASAGPSGLRRPCSQFRSVCTLMPIALANSTWDATGNPLDDFTDVRDLQRQLEQRGLELQTRADETTTGPASLIVLDPDGNPILLDQHL